MLAFLRFGRKHTDLFDKVVGARCHEHDFVFRINGAVDNAHEGNNPDVVIKPTVDNQGLKRRIRIAFRSRNIPHDAFENLIDSHPSFGRTQDGISGIDSDNIFDFFGSGHRVGARQIHLV